jgi:hypothetical protein
MLSKFRLSANLPPSWLLRHTAASERGSAWRVTSWTYKLYVAGGKVATNNCTSLFSLLILIKFKQNCWFLTNDNKILIVLSLKQAISFGYAK